MLQNKNLATRFQIMVEIAAHQPTVHQKSIAASLNVTPQAISEYMARLEEDGWVVSDGRSVYRVTQEGINWVLRMLREIDAYTKYVRSTITNVTVCSAVAESDLAQGQRVGLVMKGGLLVATARTDTQAAGIAVSDARKNEDVGVSGIEGIVEMEKGKITILKVPDIQDGGSSGVDLQLLKKSLKGADIVGAIGIEALSALRKVGVTPGYFYGVEAAIIEAARSGLCPYVVCVNDGINALISLLEEANIQHKSIDLTSF